MSPPTEQADNYIMETFTAADIAKFRSVYKKHYGVLLTDDQVARKANRLIKFVRASLQARRQRLNSYGPNQSEN